jgi:hypothetical protein
MSDMTENIIVGQIKKFVPNPNGGWFLLIAPGEGRFRADARQFPEAPAIDSIVSFLPGPKSKSGLPRRVTAILFQ